MLLLSAILVFFSVSCKDEITQPQPSLLTPEIIQKLQAAADKVMMNNQIPGMLAYVCVDGEKEGVYITRGVSNLITNEPMNVNNTWRIGSLTKMITSEAVLILVDEGLIDLSKPISFYLPELKIPGGDKITVPMLANMTSGLYSYTDDSDFMQNYINSHGQLTYTPEQLVSIAFNHNKLFDPGMGFYYNNTNYVLLGLLIKKVTGKSVPDIFNEKIFQPLGMNHTFWPKTSYLSFPYSHGYSIGSDGVILDQTNWNPSWGDAAGILISNLTDMKIYAREINESKLLSAKMKIERFKWVDDTDAPGIKYSGFGLEKIKNWIGHPGSIFGYNSELWYETEKKITLIIFTNTIDGYPADALLSAFAKILATL